MNKKNFDIYLDIGASKIRVTVFEKHENNQIFFLENNESAQNINDYKYIFNPFNINNFIEKINVQLLKEKFNNQSFIKISSYILDLNSRIISNDVGNLKLTEKEINIMPLNSLLFELQAFFQIYQIKFP